MFILPISKKKLILLEVDAIASQTYLVGVNLIFTFSMRTYSSPSLVSIFGITFAWMLTFSVDLDNG